jgi:hypothetical protein
MQLFATPGQPGEISARDFAGRWYFCDDGWLGTLTLEVTRECDIAGTITGTFSSERFGADFRVTARAGVPRPHAIEFVIHDFNWMPEQRYEGHLFTRSRGAIAGSSRWKDVPFGFFATRAVRSPLGTYRAGVARGEDFAGSWSAYLDGDKATIVLDLDGPSGTLHGSCTAGSYEYDVVGRAGGAAPHLVALTLRGPGGGQVVAELAGYLSSRPKNAISGTMTVAGTSYGFLMTRFA